MGTLDDPKISKPIMRDPEPSGTPIERKHPQDDDSNPENLEIARRRTSNGRRGQSQHRNGIVQ